LIEKYEQHSYVTKWNEVEALRLIRWLLRFFDNNEFLIGDDSLQNAKGILDIYKKERR